MKHSSSSLHHRSIWSIADLARQDVAAVLATARALKRAAHAGIALQPLRGKNIAIVGSEAPQTSADSLERAASDLGARVTHLQSTGASQALNGAEAATYRMLGRLYDAIDCVGMAPELVQRIEREAGVPVYDGLASQEHPARVIGELLEMEEHAQRPLDGLRLAFGGDGDKPRGRALMRLAARSGIAVTPANAPQADADFYIDGIGEGRWQCSGQGDAVDDAESADDHRFVLQALLVMSMA